MDPMGAEIASSVASQIVSILVAAVVGGLIVKVKAMSARQHDADDRQEAMEHAVKSLLRSSIVRDVDAAVSRGWSGDSERRSITQSYQDYEALVGPNGLIQDYMESLSELPMHPRGSCEGTD
jgi:hypothetical protein